MKRLKSLIASTLVSALILSTAACSAPTENTTTAGNTTTGTTTTEGTMPEGTMPEETKDTGKVLNIWGWNEEFKGLFEAYFAGEGKVPDGVEVKFTIVPNADNAYQNALDEALLKQDTVPEDEKIDLFLVEADYALKYVDSDYTLDIKNDVGLTDAELAGQYKYTQDIVTNSEGVLKGTSWQATPGLFAYRRSIAKDVLGTDDPTEVQAALSDWDKFNEVATKAADKGYKMLSGFDDSFRTFSNNMKGKWVDENNNIMLLLGNYSIEESRRGSRTLYGMFGDIISSSTGNTTFSIWSDGVIWGSDYYCPDYPAPRYTSSSSHYNSEDWFEGWSIQQTLIALWNCARSKGWNPANFDPNG